MGNDDDVRLAGKRMDERRRVGQSKLSGKNKTGALKLTSLKETRDVRTAAHFFLVCSYKSRQGCESDSRLATGTEVCKVHNKVRMEAALAQIE